MPAGSPPRNIGNKDKPTSSESAKAAASTASATTPADSRSSLITSALSIFHLRCEQRQRPPRPAGIFDERVFQIQVEHFDRQWLQCLDGLPLLVVVSHQHHLQTRA